MKILKNGTLIKPIGFAVLVLLVFWDAFITFQKGGESNPVWRPLINIFGLNALWAAAIITLVLFYGVTKVAGKYTNKKEGIQYGEEFVLMNLIIAFAAYDAYLTFVLPKMGYLGTRSHYAILPVIAVPVLVYNLWHEQQKRKKMQ